MGELSYSFCGKNQDMLKKLVAGHGVFIWLYPLSAEQKGEKTCYIGLTDPSARKVTGKDLLLFSIPYSRFLEMEQEADESFLTTDTWEIIRERIEKA